MYSTLRLPFIKSNDTIKDFYKKCGCKKKYYLTILLFAIISYGFSIFNRTISIDDLLTSYYVGEGNAMLRATRWGFTLYSKFFGLAEYTPFVYDLLTVLCLLIGAFLISTLLYSFSKTENVWVYIVFSCLYVSYPLINEIFEYTGANFAAYYGIVLSSYIILLISNTDKNLFLCSIFYGLLYSSVISSYEVAVFAYISIVLICMYLKYRVISKNNFGWLKEGLSYSVTLLFSLIFRFLIGFILIKLCGLSYPINGDTEIRWLNGDYADVIRTLIVSIINKYVLNYNYLPILEFIVSSIIFAIVSIKDGKQNKSIYLLSLLILISLFLLSVIQGKGLDYRQAQTVQIFVSYCGFLLMEKTTSNRRLYVVILTAMLFVCLRQSIYLHNLLALNNQRSDNEIGVINNIGYRIYSEFDRDKEVIICGKYHLEDFIDSQIRSDTIFGYRKDLIETNVNSCLNWSIKAYNSQAVLKDYFSYCGYDINISDIYFDNKVNEEYEKIAIENDINALGIKDMGDYILVYLGKID